MPIIDAPIGGINTRLPAYDKEMLERKQCVRLQNLRCRNKVVESINGNRRYHGTSLGAKITAIMPYYNDQTDQYKLLVAAGDKLYTKNESTNEFEELASGLTPNSIFSSTIRYGTMFIASTNDGLKQYNGGSVLETVGGADTAPGSFRVVIYMKEIDRLFGISDNAILGQISWCDLSQPEIWDGASVERIKLKQGERVEGAEILYGKLIIFCTYSVWIYYVSGNEENWKLEEAPNSIGCVAPSTIRKDGSRILYLGEAPGHALGIYSFNGSTSELLTDDLTPTLETRNKNKLRNACAEIHDDLYIFTIALDASEVNDTTFDLDLVNRKSDGTPAIYGPHTFGFFSSTVLNDRQKNKEWLLGDELDGFIYFENGLTFKSGNGLDGTLIQPDFLSAIHNDDLLDVLKQYNDINVFFRPTTFYDVIVKAYISYGTYAEEHTMRPAVTADGFAGEFDIYQERVLGVPELYQYQDFLDMNARGTSIQIQITSNVLAQRIAFAKYGYNFSELHQTARPQIYAN